MSGSGPDFLIIGAMKCATTTLHAQLARQDGIFMCTPKEPSFFSDEDVWARGLDWYASLFAGAPPGALCGEASTHYTKRPTHPQAAARLFAHVPGARLIYVMRHPIERVLSQYVHEWSRGRVSGPLDQAIDEVSGLIDYGRYAMQLEPYLDTFGPQAVLPVFFERLVTHGPEQLERVCAFIGYRGQPQWQEAHAANNVSAERERPSRLRDAMHRVPGMRPLVRTLLPRATRERLRRHLWRMPGRPRLSSQTAKRLRAVYDEDLRRLGGWLGIDLCCGNFAAAVDRASFRWESVPRSVGRL